MFARVRFTFNTLIEGFCSKDENAEVAMKVFKTIRKQGLKRTVITHNSLIDWGITATGSLMRLVVCWMKCLAWV